MTRAEASRINGAKSKGPKTEEGKKRSSRNALKHGLASPFILLPQESPETFQRLCAEYTRHFNPQNEVERDLVYEAVSCMWRIIRIQSAESSLIEIEISRQRHEVDQKFNNPDDWVRLAMAFENLANNGRALALMSRYESRMMRAKDRAMEQLRKLRAEPQPDEPEDDEPDENLPSEPEPSPESGIEKTPNEPETAAETSKEPTLNQPDTVSDNAPEPAPYEPDGLDLEVMPNPPAQPAISDSGSAGISVRCRVRSAVSRNNDGALRRTLRRHQNVSQRSPTRRCWRLASHTSNADPVSDRSTLTGPRGGRGRTLPGSPRRAFAPSRKVCVRISEVPQKRHASGFLTGRVLTRSRTSKITAVKVRDLMRLIEADGWKHVRTTGSHRHYKHPSKPNVVTIPVPAMTCRLAR